MNKQPILELSIDLRNKISAGEVVERPFNVVKELVENSLDASSTKIKIELIDAGIKKIIVTDNGYGMTKDEIPLALKRHATSKIRTTDDLFCISSLGFRGEALPSIASVSRFVITSSTNSHDGYRFFYDGGILKEALPSPLERGTKVEVADLFFNTLPRLNHLASFSSELAHTTAFITRIAIARTDVSFTLVNNGKTLIKTSGNNDVSEVINSLYGSEVAKSMLSFKGENDLYKISGFTTNNTINRSNKNNINVIVNNRIIKNSSIIYAITEAYKTILPISKYPVTVLFINCDPSIIDVNVHPSKLEIRFTDEANLKLLITKTIFKTLIDKQMIIEETKMENPIQKCFSFEDELPPLTAVETKKDDQLSTEDLWEMFDDAKNIDEQFEKEDEITLEETPTINYNDETLIKNDDKVFFQNFTYIGQFAKTYLIMEYEDNLYLIDQHAAMERFMYEKISNEFATPTKSVYDLLVPITLEYSLQSMILIEEKKEQIQKLGIKFDEFGPNTIIVRTVPLWINGDLINEYLRDIIDHFINNKEATKQIMFDALAKKLSCKKSIKANMSISSLEVQALMKKLDECKFPYTCPHGRPTIIKFTKYEIEKMFKRVM